MTRHLLGVATIIAGLVSCGCGGGSSAPTGPAPTDPAVSGADMSGAGGGPGGAAAGAGGPGTVSDTALEKESGAKTDDAASGGVDQ